MNIEEMIVLFNQDEPSIFDFEKADGKLHERKDLCAFLLLDKLCPVKKGDDTDMVAAAEHDQIYLEVEPEDLAKAATRDDILLLKKCGVFYDDEIGSLSMFA